MSIGFEGLGDLASRYWVPTINRGFPSGSAVEYAYNAGDTGDKGLIPGLGRSSREGNGKPFQYCWENPMDRGAWQAAGHGVTKSEMTEVTEHTKPSAFMSQKSVSPSPSGHPNAF